MNNRITLTPKTRITYFVDINGQREHGASVQLDPQAGVWVVHCEALGFRYKGFGSKQDAQDALEAAAHDSAVKTLQNYYGAA